MENAIKLMQAINASDISKMQEVNIPAVIIPDNSSVKSLEHLLDQPQNFKAKFHTQILSEFKGYCEPNMADTAAIYIDTDCMSATAIFDHGSTDNPMWGNHKALLLLKKTPGFDALIKFAGDRLNQQGMVDFFTDWEQEITFFDSEMKEILFQSAINRIRRLSIKNNASSESEIGNFNSNRSAMESIEVTAGQEQLPASFQFKTIPYDGFEYKTVLCSIRAMTSESDVQLKFRIEGFQKLIEKIAEEFKEKLFKEVNSERIYIGTIEHR